MAALTARSSFLRNLQIVEYELNSMQVKKSKRQSTNRSAVSRTRSCGERDAEFGLDKHGLRCAIHREGEACKFIRIENDSRKLGRSLQRSACGRVAYPDTTELSKCARHSPRARRSDVADLPSGGWTLYGRLSNARNLPFQNK
jgi:hypothetical protein